MSLLMIFAVISLVGMPQLVVYALLASIPVSFLLGMTAWSEYSGGHPPPDALYHEPLFWVIEGVGLLALLYVIAIAVESMTRD
jgi:hypothetical protein